MSYSGVEPSTVTPWRAAPQDTGVPAYIIAATITAAVALWMREGKTSLTIPVFVAALLLSFVLPFHIERPAARNVYRIAVYVATAFLYRVHPPQNQATFIDSPPFDQLGEICLAEIVIRSWSRYTGGRRGVAATVFLSGLLFVVATNTYDENVGRLFTPPFMLFLMFGIQKLRAEARPEAARRARLGVATAVVVSFTLGAVLFRLISINRDAITEWANRLMNGSHLQFPTTGLSEESHLGSMFGLSGSFDRVLSIHGSGDVTYMRAFSFYTYTHGLWAPSGNQRARQYQPVEAESLQTNAPGDAETVSRYSSTRGMILAPLSATSLDIDDNTLRWARDEGGPLRADDNGPDTYAMRVGPQNAQGVLAVPPTPQRRSQLLEVPDRINPKVKALARQITSGITDPLRKARAIEAYLPANHGYSLRIQVGTADPLGDFLMSNKPAHCEFFASAAVILMRYAGIPARYVIGYYAHEEEEGAIVVRQRDAHAWAECWIDGKGWVIIDATPASGKPDATSTAIPAWKRLLERFQDGLANIKEKLTAATVARFAGVVVCILLAGFLLQTRYHLTWRRRARTRVFEYSISHPELAALHARFEAACRKRGLVCPPNTPWQDYLSSEFVPLTAEARAAVEPARRFIEEYNRTRFGSAERENDALELRLNEVELSKASEKVEEETA